MKAKINFKNIIAFCQGTLRYQIYYSPFKFLIRKHIREQISFRINSMRRTCFNNGECEECGCSTTALQMANKTCGGNCYPIILNRKNWKWAKKHNCFPDKVNMEIWKLDQKNKKFYK